MDKTNAPQTETLYFFVFMDIEKSNVGELWYEQPKQ